tara:strand:- start:533 stop:1513 length:981 start_codon:yes stop_codon:yes gene_type:complete
MNVLVTGGTGFIGSHLVERLVREGHQVRALVSKNGRKNKQDAVKFLEELDVEIFEGNLLEEGSLTDIAEDVDAVFHFAAIARPSAIPDGHYFDVNEKGTQNLLKACNNPQIKKFLVMSSLAVFGPCKNQDSLNEESICGPIDTYGESKLAQEKVAEYFIKKQQLPIVILRPPTVFGPRDLEILKFIKIIKNRFFPIRSNNKCINYLYVDNLVDASLLIIEKGAAGEVYLIDNGELCSLNQVINSISNALNVQMLPFYLPNIFMVLAGYFFELAGKIFRFQPPFKHNTTQWMTEPFWPCDISKIKSLGYSPRISVVEGLKRTVKFYL